MLIRIVRMTFQKDKTESFLEVFNESKQSIRHFPGCHHLTLMQDCNDPAVFITYSHWDDEHALNAYRHSELFAEVWAATKALFSAKPVAFSMQIHTETD
ncbi:putative quinol monooxygenase [Roseivirga sp. BDSF3-8]|uniref:putative quinol monooxygenase n=1 Tax=Roseivirga sp. BDSF3-8 TaxID=3241598 RepID=UPI003531CFC0